MSGSQRLSSALSIGFLYSTANGFVPHFQPPAMTESRNPITAHRDTQSQMPSGTTNLYATKGRSKAPATAIASSSDKVKEMASFLSIQLLEKVMSDAMKPEGERIMDLEAVERITQALQTTSPTSDLPPDVTMTTISPEPTTDSEIAEDSATVSTTKDSEPTLDPTMSTKAAIPEVEPKDSTAAPDNHAKESDNIESSATIVEEEKPVVPAPAAEVPETVWSPLEVVQSNIPPLRTESIPKRTDPVAVENETETMQEDVVSLTPAEEETVEVISEEETLSKEIVVDELSAADEKSEDEALILESKKAEESFQRRLLQQKMEYDKKAASRIENESQDDSELPLSAEDTEETNEKEEDKDTTTKGESTTMNEIVSDPCESSESESPTELTTQRSSSSSSSSSPPVISQRRVETILARRQPKSSDEESKLTFKYGGMENVEDRAYAVLRDLGMIDEHKDPKDPSYDHSDDDDLCDQRYFPRM